MASNDEGSSFMTGFFVGGIIGAVVGVLLAPKSGHETRAALTDQSEVLKERAEELSARVRERAGPAVEAFREQIEPAVMGIREKIDPVVEQISKAVQAKKDDQPFEPERTTRKTASGS